MQGWSPDFIPKLAGDVLAERLIDAFQPVPGSDALQCARDLAAKEGILCGTSAGATFAAALNIAETAAPGSNILAMLPDTGERYQSTPLFDGIAETMSEEELEIAASTPRYRFDATGAPAAAAAGTKAKPEALDLVETLINDDKTPIVMFALEWCEFCWSVRKLFAANGIPYTAVDLDSVAYQQDNLGGDIRAALLEITGAPTIPQIFVGGKHWGGASDTFDGFNDGSLQKTLRELGETLDDCKDMDAYSFLPNWLHPR
jgi:cysteine synthase A